MFKFLKRTKNVELVAPISGRLIKLTEVPDKVFASGMMGKGVALESSDNTIVAPCDGEITLLPTSKHAFGMRADNNAEILVHIGLDTVNLNGAGFKALVKVNNYVKAGTPVIEFDRDAIQKQGYNLVTMLLVINSLDYNVIIINPTNVMVGQTKVVTISK